MRQALARSNGAKGMVTPGVKVTFHELEEDADLLRSLHTAFRGAAARGNYLAADRIDAQVACTEICKYIANPARHACTLIPIGRDAPKPANRLPAVL